MPKTEKFRGGANANDFLKLFDKKDVMFPSRAESGRMDFIFVPKGPEGAELAKRAYGRTWLRSVKEAQRAVGDLLPMSAKEIAQDKLRYEQQLAGLRKRSPVFAGGTTENFRQFFPIYGDGARRGTTEQWRKALGINWMTRPELRESIPPCYTEFLGRQAIKM